MQGIAHVAARIREIQSRVESPAVPGRFRAVLERNMAESADGAVVGWLQECASPFGWYAISNATALRVSGNRLRLAAASKYRESLRPEAGLFGDGAVGCVEPGAPVVVRTELGKVGRPRSFAG